MTFMEFLQAFKIWGPLGIMAALAIWGCVHLYRNSRADAAKHKVEVAELAKEFAGKLVEQQKIHHEQQTELTNRFVTLHEAAATENRELTGQVRSLIEVVSRKRGR